MQNSSKVKMDGVDAKIEQNNIQKVHTFYSFNEYNMQFRCAIEQILEYVIPFKNSCQFHISLTFCLLVASGDMGNLKIAWPN